MLTADEAREMAKENEAKLTKEFNEIEKHIEEAILNGQFSITKTGHLHPAIKRYLKKFGYFVKDENEYDLPYYVVSWEQGGNA